MANIRVLVADDEPLARRGVRQLLVRRHVDMTVVGESRNGPETLRALDELKPDLLFLDVQMPEMDELRSAARAWGLSACPQWSSLPRTIVLRLRAFDAHAMDYLVKPLKVERFESAPWRGCANACRLMQSADLAKRS